MSSLLDNTLTDLLDAGLTPQQLTLTRFLLGRYAVAAAWDSALAREAMILIDDHQEEYHKFKGLA